MYLVLRNFKKQTHTIPKGYTIRRNGDLYYKVYNREGKIHFTSLTLHRDAINQLLEDNLIEPYDG